MLTTNFDGKTYRLPDFFIPGAAKSGTTTVYQLLVSHPEIFFPKSRKEPFYFSFGDERPDYEDDRFNRIPIWQSLDYLRLYEEAGSSQLAGDASTSYLYTSKKSLGLMKQWYGDQLKEVRAMIILRNPVERAYSHYTYLIRNGFEERSFEEAISQEGISKWKKKRWGFDYLAYGEYADQVEDFMREIPQTKVWIMEDLKKGDSFLSEVLDFLQVSPMSVKEPVKANPSGIPKSKGLVNLLRKNPVVRGIGKRLPESVQRELKIKRDKVMSKLLVKEPMNPETADRLREYYRENIEKLGTLIDRDLSAWLHP